MRNCHRSASVLALDDTHSSVLTSLLQLADVSQGGSDYSYMRHLRYTLLMPDTSQRSAAMHFGSQLFTAVDIHSHTLYC